MIINVTENVVIENETFTDGKVIDVFVEDFSSDEKGCWITFKNCILDIARLRIPDPKNPFIHLRVIFHNCIIKDFDVRDFMGKDRVIFDFHRCFIERSLFNSLRICRVSECRLKSVVFRDCFFDRTYFRCTKFDNERRDVRLLGCLFNSVNFSGSKTRKPSEFIKEHFEYDEHGFYAYKTFNSAFDAPSYWKIEKGAILEEYVNPDPFCACACGINVAEKELTLFRHGSILAKDKIYKLFIPWDKSCEVVIPYDYRGAIRTGYAEIVDEVKIGDD